LAPTDKRTPTIDQVWAFFYDFKLGLGNFLICLVKNGLSGELAGLVVVTNYQILYHSPGKFHVQDACFQVFNDKF
jgi:hypothetical protein